MFSLTDAHNYWLYSEATDMRKSFFSLSGIVSNVMKRDPLNGDAYIFINKSATRIKILRMESGGLVLYCKILEEGRLHRPESNNEGQIEWSDLVLMVEGIVKNDQLSYKRSQYLKLLKNGLQ